MAFQVFINEVDRTEYIEKGSLFIEDVLTSQVDTAGFRIKAKGYYPAKGDKVEIYYNDVLKFGGRIVDVNKYDNIYEVIEVTCQDWSVDMSGIRITKIYNNQTAEEIIDDIIDIVNDRGGHEFTATNVEATQPLGKVVYNYMEATKAIEELAVTLNMQWYIDENKDVHFFNKGAETAPFNITTVCKDVIGQSLQLSDSLSELRNAVVVRGGEFQSDNTREEAIIMDGSQVIINLGYKYAVVPTVELDGTPLSVGVENLNNAGLEDGTFDCLWDFNQKYLRFKNPPTVGLELVVAGYPLFPLIVVAESASSISTFGRREFLVDDIKITSVDVAIERAIAELEAFARGVKSGEFKTYTDGCRSGQQIQIDHAGLGVSGSFLIRSVTMEEFGVNGAMYTVRLQSDKVLGIIEFLQKLLMKGRQTIGIREGEIPNVIYMDDAIISVDENITRITPRTDYATVEVEETIRHNPFTPEWVLGPYFPVDENDPKTPMRLDISSYLY